MSNPDQIFRIVEESKELVHAISREIVVRAPRRFASKSGFEVIVPEAIVEQLCAIGRASDPNEWMGVLLGRLGHDRDGDYVLIDGVVCDSQTIVSPHSVRSTPTGEAIVRRLAGECFPASIIVGWGHGHLRCGPLFSGTDISNQSTWTMPYAVGIVCDPWSIERIGVYYGAQSEKLTESAGCDVQDQGLHSSLSIGGSGMLPEVHRTPIGPTRVGTRKVRAKLLKSIAAALVVAAFSSTLFLQTRTLSIVHQIRERTTRTDRDSDLQPLPPRPERPWGSVGGFEQTCRAAPDY